MTKGKLFVISGPSGAGKGTICRSILEEAKDIKFSVSMTTRAPREGEVHGKHYYFATHEEFRQLIAENGFMEHAEVYGNFYGTPRKQAVDWMEAGNDVILEIDVQGALQVKESYPEAVLVFILPPSIEELKNRITGRGSETEETMKKRLGAALQEINCIDKYDYRVVNLELADAIKRVKAIIMAEQCKLNDEEVGRIVNRYKEDL